MKPIISIPPGEGKDNSPFPTVLYGHGSASMKRSCVLDSGTRANMDSLWKPALSHSHFTHATRKAWWLDSAKKTGKHQIILTLHPRDETCILTHP